MSNEKTKTATVHNDGQKLENICNALGISIHHLATKIGVSHGAMYHIKYGRNGLSNEMADKIIEAFPNVSYNYLKRNQLPVLLNDNEMMSQIKRFNMPNNNFVSISDLEKFVTIPVTLETINQKLDMIMDKLGIKP